MRRKGNNAPIHDPSGWACNSTPCLNHSMLSSPFPNRLPLNTLKTLALLPEVMTAIPTAVHRPIPAGSPEEATRLIASAAGNPFLPSPGGAAQVIGQEAPAELGELAGLQARPDVLHQAQEKVQVVDGGQT